MPNYGLHTAEPYIYNIANDPSLGLGAGSSLHATQVQQAGDTFLVLYEYPHYFRIRTRGLAPAAASAAGI